MPDDAKLDEVEAIIRAASRDILAGFDREHVPTQMALAICGAIVARLLDRCDDDLRAQFLACFEHHHDA